MVHGSGTLAPSVSGQRSVGGFFSESYGLGLRKKIGVNLYASGKCTMLLWPVGPYRGTVRLEDPATLTIRNGTVGWYDHWMSTCVDLVNIFNH